MTYRDAVTSSEENSRFLQTVDTVAAIAGVGGTERWLVGRFEVVGLFSLKSSMATSSVGKTLLLPTPYAVKMALVDAGFRAGLSDEDCGRLLAALADVPVRVAPTPAAVVTHTFVKIRQEPKRPDPACPYISNIAYREVVHCQGEWRWAFDLEATTAQVANWLTRIIHQGKQPS